MKSHANTQLHTRLVAAGVDGSQEGLAAARYAVHAADVRGLDVLLVHAYELPPLNTPVDESMVDACHRLAQKLVDDTAAVLVTPLP